MSTQSFIDQLLEYKTFSMQEIQQKFSVSDDQINRNATYTNLTGITEIHNEATPGYFYYNEGKFLLFYVGNSKEVRNLKAEELYERYGGYGEMLTSRAGKIFMHHVYPEAGIAFSSDGENVRILEVFMPMSLESYKELYYEEPPSYRA